MKTIARYIKIYFMVISQYVKTRMQYRADFFVGMLGVSALNLANVAILWLIFNTIPAIKGWTYNELLFFFGFFLLAHTPQQFFFDIFWYLSGQLRSGEFIRYYFKPLNMMFYFMSWHLDLKGFAHLGFGIAITVYAAGRLAIDWSVWTILLLAVNWVSASLIMISLVVGGMSSAFWIINSNSLTITISGVRDIAKYPLDIFNDLFRGIFTFIAPIGFIAFYPCQILLRPVSEVPAAAWASPAAGFLMFGIAYLIWKKGVSIWAGTGS
jgi:ABC-2 type transport system permease protein